ncbi:MAG TPA: carbamoyltransferase HypF, partial [Solirubrobacteraceae bacterium]|nr:carbamoyltransferase HypF [Solirubrobacteraceae bacterium]
MSPPPGRCARIRVSVDGVVQGVGFRPFVHRLAREHQLSGWVRNGARGVVLEAEGDASALERFLGQLAEDPPPLASVEGMRTVSLAAIGERGFRILASDSHDPDAEADVDAPQRAPISPDIAPCGECLREMLDPCDRRYRYPFINCTDCGPRFTIIRATPYDRPSTTMAAFAMCETCRSEYEDPDSRRFHAQPNACPQCGPTLRLLAGAGAGTRPAGMRAARLLADAPLAGAAAALASGMIVAVKGAGGYHLACRADDERAVLELRRRKGREQRPFAVMAPDARTLHRLVEISPAQAALASAPERPIVIACRRRMAPVADAVAPGLRDLGVMLPSTPLHHLLLHDLGTALVMTSGNPSGEPIVCDDEQALVWLAPIADLLLVHDRAIHVRVDDSVVRVLDQPPLERTDAPKDARAPAGAPASVGGRRSTGVPAGALMIRRSRGHAPRSIALPVATRPLLACGAELKSTFCLARDSRGWVGPHVGDLGSWETLRSFDEGVAHFEALFGVEPAVVAHDLHPDYISSTYARGREGVELIAVQHHHAHFAAVLAEHGCVGPAVGAIYDGAGLGSDGTVWGGELLAGDLAQVRRVGHLQPVRLPGGDAAARQPWRMACSWLAAAHGGHAPRPKSIGAAIDRSRWEQVAELIRTGVASPVTTSMGRLFDAVAALCAIRMSARDEGLAAMELEAAADPAERSAYPLRVCDGELLGLDARETVRTIANELERGVSPRLVSARFHNGVARATVNALETLAEREGVGVVVLSGGVF